MRIANREFKPKLAGTLAALALLSFLISLGFWQLRRADEKRALIEQFASGASNAQLLSRATIDHLPRLQEVVAHGTYDGAHQVLLDNMPAPAHAAGAVAGVGFEVLTPLQLDDGSIALVNRGWVPLGRTRSELPNIQVDADSRSTRGRLAELQKPGLRMANVDTSTSWPRVLNYPSLEELRELYGERLLARIVLLDPDEPNGFAREWSARFTFEEFGPERHIGYAVQWFAFAAALIVIYFATSLKRPENRGD
jgi:surfeit locus 1 family protein